MRFRSAVSLASSFSGARPEGRDGRGAELTAAINDAALQWGPTRGPGWSFVRANRVVSSNCFSGARPEGRDGRRGLRRTPGCATSCFSGARPEGRDGRGRHERPYIHHGASVGPDPRAGMVGVSPGTRGRPVQASVGPDPRAGMVASSLGPSSSSRAGFSGARPEGRDGRRWSPRAQRPRCNASVGPDPRAGMVEGSQARHALLAPGFSGARPEGRDGRGDDALNEYAHGLLQWGPTRGPGWSACRAP